MYLHLFHLFSVLLCPATRPGVASEDWVPGFCAGRFPVELNQWLAPTEDPRMRRRRHWDILSSSPLPTLRSWSLHDFYFHLVALPPTASPSLGSISINLLLWPSCQKDTINEFLFPRFLSQPAFTALYFLWPLGIPNVGQIHRLIKVFPPVLQTGLFCYFAFHFLHICWTGLFIILQICLTNICFNTSVWCCSSLEFHVPFIFLYWNLMFLANPTPPYDCVSPILLQETDSFSQKANLLHKKYRANSQNLGNYRSHVRLELEVSENQTWKLLSPSLGPQVSFCLQLSACLLYYSHSHSTNSVFCMYVQWKLTSYVLYPNIPISWREKLRNPVEPMGWLP